MASIYDILEVITSTNQKSVLASVIKVEGSAYRKEGASMLFLENGRQVGTISAGCLETDLVHRTQSLFQGNNKTFETIVYDMSAEDDFSWGRGSGCNGKVEILLEIIDEEYKHQLCSVRNQLKKNKQVIGLTFFQTSSISRTYLMEGYPIPNKLDRSIIKLCYDIWHNKKSRLVNMQDKGNVFTQFFLPKPRLFIFGAGPDVEPLAFISDKVGFAIHIWDFRTAYLNKKNFPKNVYRENISINEMLKKTKFLPSDSIIIMTHDFQKDKELLQLLKDNKHVRYFGILGPRRRTERLLHGETIPNFLHSPVGLSIGAEGPEEISISIVADLIRAQRQEGGITLIEEDKDRWYLSSSGKK